AAPTMVSAIRAMPDRRTVVLRRVLKYAPSPNPPRDVSKVNQSPFSIAMAKILLRGNHARESRFHSPTSLAKARTITVQLYPRTVLGASQHQLRHEQQPHNNKRLLPVGFDDQNVAAVKPIVERFEAVSTRFAFDPKYPALNIKFEIVTGLV